MTANFLSEITGSFSQSAADNPTVALMEATYRHHGLNWRYVNCEVGPMGLAAAVAGARAMNWAGFNCSMPHKVSVVALLDGLAPSARIIGAVNCVVRRDSLYIGENTDGQGFLASLRGLINPKGLVVLILGAGGAARACAVELSLAGAQKVIVANRSPQKGNELVALLTSRTDTQTNFIEWDSEISIPAEVDLLINATSIGLFPAVEKRPHVDLTSLHARQIVADIIPNPSMTSLLLAAEQKGCRILNGFGMLINQAALNVEYWTGISPDRDVMRQCMEELFSTGYVARPADRLTD